MLWKDFRFVSDGMTSAGLRLRITMKRGDANGYGERAGPRVMARVRITGLGCCTERMSQLFGLGPSSEVSVSV